MDTARDISELSGDDAANKCTEHRWFKNSHSGDANCKESPVIDLGNDELKAVVDARRSQTMSVFGVPVPTMFYYLKRL